MGSYSTIASTARSEAGAPRHDERATNGVTAASSSLPVVAARRVGHAAADRGPGRVRVARVWSDGPRVAAAVLLWVAWAVGLLATLAPRPHHAHRAARRSRPRSSSLAVARRDRRRTVDARDRRRGRRDAIVCASLASGHDIASAAANALAYGDEQRFPLRVPPALFLGPLPLARAARRRRASSRRCCCSPTARSCSASSRSLVGARRSSSVLSRSLDSLSRRWAVLVPAGFVVVDPMTLADPVLFLREHVRDVGARARRRGTAGRRSTSASAPARARCRCASTRPIDLIRAARGRRGGETVTTAALLVAVARRDEMLRRPATRRPCAAGRASPVRWRSRRRRSASPS